MIIILIDKDRYRSKYLSDKLKENYKAGRIHHLSSIDKVKETAQLVKWTKNYGLAKEVENLWKSYNISVADDIIDYIRHYKREEDIVLINIDNEEDAHLFMSRCPYSAYMLFIGGAPQKYVDEKLDEILKNKNDTRTN